MSEPVFYGSVDVPCACTGCGKPILPGRCCYGFDAGNGPRTFCGSCTGLICGTKIDPLDSDAIISDIDTIGPDEDTYQDASEEGPYPEKFALSGVWAAILLFGLVGAEFLLVLWVAITIIRPN